MTTLNTVEPGNPMESQPPDRGHPVLYALRGASRFLERRIGWHRIGVALSLAIIVVAVLALFRHLRDIEVRDVMQAVRDIEWSAIALAALFVACGYFTLTFYDLFALRTIGRP